MVRITPAIPCCDGCLIEAAARAGFNYTAAFVVVSGLEELAPEELTTFVGSMVSATKAKAFLFVETPLPVEEAAADEAAGAEDAPDSGEPEGSN